MKVYEGTRGADRMTTSVVVGTSAPDGTIRDPQPLNPRSDLYNHACGEFNWGYGGSGPSQLALALCADVLGDDARARAIYMHYKWQHIAKWPEAGWRVTDVQVRYDIEMLESQVA